MLILRNKNFFEKYWRQHFWAKNAFSGKFCWCKQKFKIFFIHLKIYVIWRLLAKFFLFAQSGSRDITIFSLTTSWKRHFLTSLNGFCPIAHAHMNALIKHSEHFIPTYNTLQLSHKRNSENGWNRCAFFTENWFHAVNCLSDPLTNFGQIICLG